MITTSCAECFKCNYPIMENKCGKFTNERRIPLKRVFLSHKFRDNPEQNFAEILEIGRKLAKLNIAYFSPITNYCALDDTDGAQREFGLKCCEEWIPYCDELWLFGDWEKSEGCIRERNTALLELIPIYEVVGWDGDYPVFANGAGPEWIRRVSIDITISSKKVSNNSCRSPLGRARGRQNKARSRSALSLDENGRDYDSAGPGDY